MLLRVFCFALIFLSYSFSIAAPSIQVVIEPNQKHILTLKASTSFVGVDLKGINLRGADLTEADLSGADLRGADLTDADMSGVKR